MTRHQAIEDRGIAQPQVPVSALHAQTSERPTRQDLADPPTHRRQPGRVPGQHDAPVGAAPSAKMARSVPGTRRSPSDEHGSQPVLRTRLSPSPEHGSARPANTTHLVPRTRAAGPARVRGRAQARGPRVTRHLRVRTSPPPAALVSPGITLPRECSNLLPGPENHRSGPSASAEESMRWGCSGGTSSYGGCGPTCT